MLDQKELLKNIRFRMVIQRCQKAEVSIASQSQGVMGQGLVVFFAVGWFNNFKAGTFEPAFEAELLQKLTPVLNKIKNKILALRIFSDANKKMNLSLNDMNGAIYIVSQFTLFSDCARGNRPSFIQTVWPELASSVYVQFVNSFKESISENRLHTGIFGADMQVSLVNDGPVTIILDADSEGFL